MQNIVKEKKAEIGSLEERMDETLDKFKNGKITVSGVLYGLPDYATKRMMFYDQYGELIESRDLLPDELQGNAFGKKGGPFKELPLPTQDAINQKLKDGEKDGSLSIEGPNDEEFPHNEDGWEKMDDKQLMEKYGTAAIHDIRLMKWVPAEGKYLSPEAIAKLKKKKPVFNSTSKIDKKGLK